jgi:hypothetical protein
MPTRPHQVVETPAFDDAAGMENENTGGIADGGKPAKNFGAMASQPRATPRMPVICCEAFAVGMAVVRHCPGEVSRVFRTLSRAEQAPGTGSSGGGSSDLLAVQQLHFQISLGRGAGDVPEPGRSQIEG